MLCSSTPDAAAAGHACVFWGPDHHQQQPPPAHTAELSGPFVHSTAGASATVCSVCQKQSQVWQLIHRHSCLQSLPTRPHTSSDCSLLRFWPTAGASAMLCSTLNTAAAALGMYLTRFLRRCFCSRAASCLVILTLSCMQCNHVTPPLVYVHDSLPAPPLVAMHMRICSPEHGKRASRVLAMCMPMHAYCRPGHGCYGVKLKISAA